MTLKTLKVLASFLLGSFLVDEPIFASDLFPFEIKRYILSLMEPYDAKTHRSLRLTNTQWSKACEPYIWKALAVRCYQSLDAPCPVLPDLDAAKSLTQNFFHPDVVDTVHDVWALEEKEIEWYPHKPKPLSRQDCAQVAQVFDARDCRSYLFARYMGLSKKDSHNPERACLQKRLVDLRYAPIAKELLDLYGDDSSTSTFKGTIEYLAELGFAEAVDMKLSGLWHGWFGYDTLDYQERKHQFKEFETHLKAKRAPYYTTGRILTRFRSRGTLEVYKELRLLAAQQIAPAMCEILLALGYRLMYKTDQLLLEERRRDFETLMPPYLARGEKTVLDQYAEILAKDYPWFEALTSAQKKQKLAELSQTQLAAGTCWGIARKIRRTQNYYPIYKKLWDVFLQLQACEAPGSISADKPKE